MSLTIRILSFAALLSAIPATKAAGPLDKVAVYSGTWNLKAEHFATPYSKASKEATTIKNDCWRSGNYFACNQFVDGDSKALLIFTYNAKDDTYTSYPIPQGGGKAGSGKLLIKGDVWTFPWEDEADGKPVYFQVVNVFTSPGTIEYRQEFSTDNVHWTLMAKGTETKDTK